MLLLLKNIPCWEDKSNFPAFDAHSTSEHLYFHQIWYQD